MTAAETEVRIEWDKRGISVVLLDHETQERAGLQLAPDAADLLAIRLRHAAAQCRAGEPGRIP